MRKSKYRLIALAAFATAFVSNRAFANQLVNGSFESPILPPDTYLDIGPGGEPFGWNVTIGNIDIVRLPLTSINIHFNAFDGNQLLDLNGFTRGAINQNFSTVAGQLYRLAFAYADNPRGEGLATASVTVTDVATFTPILADVIAHESSSDFTANYLPYTNSFLATGATTRLIFVSTSLNGDPSGGIFLDAVDVSPIPEPSTFGVAVWGILTFAASRLRRIRP